MGCLHLFRTDSALKKRERLCGNHDYCRVDMAEKGKNILKYYFGERSLKTPFALYADFECLLIKEQSFHNNLERKAKHEPSVTH